MDIMRFGSRTCKSGLELIYNFREQHKFTQCNEAESINFTYIMDMQTQVIIKRLVVKFLKQIHSLLEILSIPFRMLSTSSLTSTPIKTHTVPL